PKAAAPKAAAPKAAAKPTATAAKPGAPAKAGAPAKPTAPKPHVPIANFDGYQRVFQDAKLIRRQGKVTQVIGQVVEAYNPGTSVGGLCTLYNPDTNQRVMAEVIGFRDDKMLLMTLGQMSDISPRCRVVPEDRPPTVPVGFELLGRVIDGLGRPID